MGLEAVEFVIDVEKAFGLSIPDRDFNELSTPRKLVGYLVGRLPGDLWTKAEIEQVVEGLLAKASGRADFALDADFRSIFR
jgi:hypothetical protein